MLAIPVPFVVALLLILLAINLYVHYQQQAKLACIFLGVCALTTSVIGLRWTFEWNILRILQPLLASIIPIIAWYCFALAYRSAARISSTHMLAPLLVILFIMTKNHWPAPLDLLITVIYIGARTALLHIARRNTSLLNVAFSRWEWARRAAFTAGIMLLFSALIDSAMSVDFSFFQGLYAAYILAIGQLLLLPLLATAVIIVSINTARDTPSGQSDEPAPKADSEHSQLLSDDNAADIIAQLDRLMRNKETFLYPELTLSRLARKLCIPPRQLSMAVNQVYQRNISKVINEYRIERAKHALKHSDETITQILMSSGFLSKSNFNREFTRVTGMTPSEYRERSDEPLP